MDETETSADIEQMAHAAAFRNMVPYTEASSAMDIGKCRLLPNTISARTELSRPDRPDADQVEDLPEAQTQRGSGELPHYHRRGRVNRNGE